MQHNSIDACWEELQSSEQLLVYLHRDRRRTNWCQMTPLCPPHVSIQV